MNYNVARSAMSSYEDDAALGNSIRCPILLSSSASTITIHTILSHILFKMKQSLFSSSYNSKQYVI